LALKLLALTIAKMGGCVSTTELKNYFRGKGSVHAAAIKAARVHLERLQNRIEVIYKPHWNIDNLAGYITRQAASGGVLGVLVDYLQLIPAAVDGGRRDIDISRVARALKVAAVTGNVPVVAAAQLGREQAKNSDNKKPAKNSDNTNSDSGCKNDVWKKRRPRLHYLREGGSEQEADLVLGLNNFDAWRASEGGEGETLDGELEVYCLKNRFGANGCWELHWQGVSGLITENISDMEGVAL
jgi:replicative DNA helicase